MGSRMSLNTVVQNFLLTRTAWLKKLLDPRRDIEAECGHPETIDIKDYNDLFERGDIARRIVSLFPEESWSESPAIIEDETGEETEFEKQWKEINQDFRMWSLLQRVDILSGIGRFGVLLLGFDDGRPLSEPVQGTDNKLIYLRPFEEYLVDITSIENDQKNKRFGQPNLYSIRFVDTTTTSGQPQTTQSAVHWTRIIHVADNRTNSDVYGTPRLKWVFNRVLDLRKITGGSGEMFWKGGFPGLSLESAVPEQDVEFDEEATKEQMERYMNGLQRYLALTGMSAKSLAPQVADPMPHIDAQLKLIAAAIGCPWRVFIGSEQSQLASSQDTRAWNKRINRRREEYLTPFVIRPIIERLMEFGALTQSEDYDIKWPDLNTPSDEDKALVAERTTNALSKYVGSGVDALVPPFQYLTIVCGMSDDEANGIIKQSGDRLEEMADINMEKQRLELEGQEVGIEGQRKANTQIGKPSPNGRPAPARRPA